MGYGCTSHVKMVRGKCDLWADLQKSKRKCQKPTVKKEFHQTLHFAWPCQYETHIRLNESPKTSQADGYDVYIFVPYIVLCVYIHIHVPDTMWSVYIGN